MNENTGVYVTAIGCASPDYSADQERALAEIREEYGPGLTERSGDLLEKFFGHPSIERRSLAIQDPGELFGEDADERMDRFTREAVDLSARASRKALQQAGLSPDAVEGLVVNTCTGYICPGVSNYLIEELGLSRDIHAYDLVGAGCGGAIPNLELASSICPADPDEVVLSISVEICTATFQMGDDPALLLSNALFADGAAAAVLNHRPPGLQIQASQSIHEPRYRDDIRYVYRNGQLHNQLSVTLPAKSTRVVSRLVEGFFEEHNLRAGEVEHWAVHPGGERVINRLQELVGLSDRQVRPTRDVLRDYGNLSSASVWFVLRHILDEGMDTGDRCIMLSFGAGLSAHMLLLERTGENDE